MGCTNNALLSFAISSKGRGGYPSPPPPPPPPPVSIPYYSSQHCGQHVRWVWSIAATHVYWSIGMGVISWILYLPNAVSLVSAVSATDFSNIMAWPTPAT